VAAVYSGLAHAVRDLAKNLSKDFMEGYIPEFVPAPIRQVAIAASRGSVQRQ
jgi:hypothetical protein